MKKIFKYPYDKVIGKATLPENARILRIENVNDAQYKDIDSVWAIVEVGDENVERNLCRKFPYSLAYVPGNIDSFHQIQLAVKEKQVIQANGPPFYAKEDDGKMFVYCETGGEPAEYEIEVYKTGQEITEPVEELVYLGLNRLWIIQELGLYSFWRKK